MCFLVANIKPTDCESNVSYYSSELLCAHSYDLLLFFPNIGLCHMSERLVNCGCDVILSYILWPNMLLVLLSSQHGAIIRLQIGRVAAAVLKKQRQTGDRWPISFGVTWGTNSFSPQKGSVWSVFHRAPEFIGVFEKLRKWKMAISSKLLCKYCIRHNMYFFGPSDGNSRLLWDRNMEYKMD